MSAPTARHLITAKRVLVMVAQADRMRVPRVEILRPDTWQPFGEPEKVMAEVNAVLHNADLAWTARRDGNRVWISRDAK